MIDSENRQGKLRMRVVYDDLPDLVEIETAVQVSAWSGKTQGYASPNDLHDQALALAEWCTRPQGVGTLEIGADNGTGRTVLRFDTIDMAGHVVCHVQLATGGLPSNARAEQIWRLSVEIRAEIASIERFSRHIRAMIESPESEALLLES